MYSAAKLKVPGGKLISVKVTYWHTIDGVQILGDFFIYPEESLNAIEKSLVGMDAKASEQEISRHVQSVVDRNGITLVGLTPEAIAQVVKQAIKSLNGE